MKVRLIKFCGKISFFVLLFTACENKKSIENKRIIKVIKPISKSETKLKKSVDTLKISFEQFELYINNLKVIDSKNQLTDTFIKDTISINIDIGESIEKSGLHIVSDSLNNIKIEQGFESVLVINGDGEFCILEKIPSRFSILKEIKPFDSGDYMCYSYGKNDVNLFKAFNVDTLKTIAHSECNCPNIDSVKYINDKYAFESITNYYIKISASIKNSNKKVIKYIIINKPIGC